ncbi:MAG TPA: acetyl-CoA carboxylase carboxyltransferase subunit alpha [Candidatus Sulfopaludibacter sp.]|nr:acetyl-CoA carboxylase carboxyltransferase subunit alpha [Candidatus Sulfopaludibacter sp.]
MKHQLDFEKPIIELQAKLDDLREHPEKHSMDVSFEEEIRLIEKKLEETRRQIFSNLNAWQRVQLARHPKRPYTLDYLEKAFTGFHELHGDRLFADDHAMVGGLAKLGDHRVMVIGTQKGRDTKENIFRNFGSAHPEGYRKALRLMRLANKFSIPIITLIDISGAYPGIGSEERHVAEAIAVNLREMTLLEVPIIAAVTGEGGSGGALGIGMGDRVLMLENAYYSVIPPEGCAAILWRDRAAAPKAAAALKITAKELLEFKIIDEIIPEPLGGAHLDPDVAAENLKIHLLKHLEEVLKLPVATRLKERYDKYRAHGHFLEKSQSPATEARPAVAAPANVMARAAATA